MQRTYITMLTLLCMVFSLPLWADETRLLRQPDISETHVAFVYGNDIWVTDHDGQNAKRLTSFPGTEAHPHFSPDGQHIAFTAEYDGNTDVYLVPVQGGEPQRRTWHPAVDRVRGWTPDGQRIVFASVRHNAPVGGLFKFWTIALDEKMPQPLPIPRIAEGQYAPDGRHMVYQKIFPWESEWRNYRGGQTDPIRIIDLQTLDVQKLPWDGSNDKNPVWIGDMVYFLSDRDYAMNVWSYHTPSQELTQVTFFETFDCKHLEAGGGQLIFENGGYLYTLQPPSGEPQKLSITVRGDFPWARTHWEKVASSINTFALSPSGKRAVFEARGDIFTVPAEKGDVRNLTASSAVADRNAVWSPDGKHISWFSDASGEYQLIIADQFGQNQRTIELPDPTFYYTPQWSPDSKYISYTDADRNLWVVDVQGGPPTLIDNSGFAHPQRTIYPEWSPDSKWIAYTKRLTNQYNAVFVYSLEKNRSYRLTDGLSNCTSPAWDAGGKYLYFLASTNYGLNVGWLDLSSLERPIRRAIYMAVLPSDEPSPLLPESDDEAVKEADEEEKANDKEDKDTQPVTIDLDGIDQRILALDLEPRDYRDLQAGKEGTLFYLESVPHEKGLKLHRYSLKDRETKEVISGIRSYM
ncbi:MAG: protease, partial [Caldithrix sp.]|nr:protease [Caldithrix sp.]